MKTVLFALLLIAAAPVVGFAQIDDLMNDPDVVWIGEIELEYVLEPELIYGITTQKEFLFKNKEHYFQVKKHNFDYCDGSDSFSTHIINLAENQILPVYKTSEHSERLAAEDLENLFYSIDTAIHVISKDPNKTFQLVKSRINPEIITSFLVNQIWYFDKKKQILTNRVLGMSLITTQDSGLINDHKKVLCYVAFPNSSDKHYNLNLPEILLTIETTEYINLNSFKSLKGNMQEFFEQLFFKEPKQKQIDTYSRESGVCCKNLVTQEEYGEIFEPSIDTIVSSTEGLVFFENPALSFADYSTEYRVIQTWYFDAEANQLISSLDAIAPTKPILDDNGNFLYNQSLFYLCFSKSTTAEDKRR